MMLKLAKLMSNKLIVFFLYFRHENVPSNAADRTGIVRAIEYSLKMLFRDS